MCLRVKDNAYIKIAEKDIVCYKFVKKGFLNLTWHSPIFERKIRRKYKEIIKSVDHLKFDCEDTGSRSSNFIISQGFHAFLTGDAAINDSLGIMLNDFSCSLRQCIIPKGSEYCLGEFETIVSNQIIVTRNVFICTRK